MFAGSVLSKMTQSGDIYLSAFLSFLFPTFFLESPFLPMPLLRIQPSSQALEQNSQGSNCHLLLPACAIPNTTQRALKKEVREMQQMKGPRGYVCHLGPCLWKMLKKVIGHSALHFCGENVPGQSQPGKAMVRNRVAALGKQYQSESSVAGTQEGFLGDISVSSP